MDDGARMGKETIRKYFRHFCRDIPAVYGGLFLNRRPSKVELKGIEECYRESGFIGCVGAVDCMKLHWKNCPASLKGQFHNSKEGKLATIVVEAWCDTQLYVWHWYAGRAGTNNDKTLVTYSPLFTDILAGRYKLDLGEDYKVCRNRMLRRLCYFLVDGIYFPWPIFAKPIHDPMDTGEQIYTKKQEARRKDIERCFGVLQSRFQILRRENMRWDKREIVRISETCVILHNILIRMMQKGAFDEEVGAGETASDIICELCEEEATFADQTRVEQEAVDEDIEGGVLSDEVAEADRLFLLDSILTNEGMHTSL